MATKPHSAAMSPGPGLRIRRTIERPPAELIEKFAQFETPDISDVLNRLYTVAPGIRNLVDDKSIVGPACTVKVYPDDNLMVHKSLDVAEPGDVVVVDTGGEMNAAVLGDLIATKAKHRGIRGFVVDGLVRDLPGLRAVGLPVFARGVTPMGPLHRGPGELNYSISCGGIVVMPGDVIAADASGVVVIPRVDAAEILARLTHQKEALADYTRDVRRGLFSNDWVDEAIAEIDCLITD